MGFLEWLGISPRDDPELPKIEDNVRDSGQTFVFGRADSGERVDEKSAMQIATVYACVRLLVSGSWQRRWLGFRFICIVQWTAEAQRNEPQIIRCISCCTGSRIRR